MLEAVVDSEVLWANTTPGSTTADVRDVLVLISPRCFVGQSLKDAWYSRARCFWRNSLLSSSWLKGDSLSCAAVRSNQGKGLGRENKQNLLLQLANNLINNVLLQCLTTSLFFFFFGLWETIRLRDVKLKCSRHYCARHSRTKRNACREILYQ